MIGNHLQGEEFDNPEFIVNGVAGAVDGGTTAAISGYGPSSLLGRAAVSGLVAAGQHVANEAWHGRQPKGIHNTGYDILEEKAGRWQ
jgi:hypothetical protein